jgi:hypothetical protein
MRNRTLGGSSGLIGLALGATFALAVGCVPNGPASSSDAGSGQAPKPRPPISQQVAPPPTALNRGPTPVPSPPLVGTFEDDFERAALGPDWITTSGDWRIEAGRLCAKGARNHGAWLARTLPVNARIEFDAVSNSIDGDIKAEVFGDGASAASGVSYNDATSYLTIFGGWKNTFHVLARKDEHARDRPEIKITPGSDDERARPVSPGQVYHFKIERADGKTIRWWVGDMLMFKFTDPEPLTGTGHDHFGFNDWDVPVCFDNVKVTAI